MVWSPTPSKTRPGATSIILVQSQVLHPSRSHVLGSNPLEMRPGVLPPISIQLQVLISTKEPRFGVEPTGDASWCPPTHLYPAPGPGPGIPQGATFWGRTHWRCVLVSSHPSPSSSRSWYPPRSHVLGSNPLEMRPGVLPPIFIQLQVLVLVSPREPRFGVEPTGDASLVSSHPSPSSSRSWYPPRSHVLGSNPLEMRPGVLPPISIQLQVLVSPKEPRFGVEPTGDASWCPPTHLYPAPGPGIPQGATFWGSNPLEMHPWCPPTHLYPAPGPGIHRGATFWGQSHHPSDLPALSSPTSPVEPPDTTPDFFRSRAEDAGTVAGLEEKAEEDVFLLPAPDKNPGVGVGRRKTRRRPRRFYRFGSRPPRHEGRGRDAPGAGSHSLEERPVGDRGDLLRPALAGRPLQRREVHLRRDVGGEELGADGRPLPRPGLHRRAAGGPDPQGPGWHRAVAVLGQSLQVPALQRDHQGRRLDAHQVPPARPRQQAGETTAAGLPLPRARRDLPDLRLGIHHQP
ncbi:uncharacterized protein LOC126035117 isoform X6 [Accipiter gentilis]|uniref:uncharacterized protein LOC126035117 isoform X6 n=1 Tax=Astur gentilis TaxID=8957 RepID=UPI0021108AAD|nr:uncharacterized protein LOC126035117 isoform X6 [Accipiter gentilis]XP_049649129.1 uncharacterized protein LOC126035117 isoform X6 [Accipiter gentilis]XP_049649130.1 uncharacterized protein LOC126035117 isoform X6 [Accipiter gentilis]XP_049649131.1 uncharacterized protein LOC126035117 isoform X6 [Accipiter gentilis]XP_049649133.1 uncharacterized protein LOC126035117 isoform X6 [Accipiter gentilis]XP_049649134.1 uncharacterized protein LOC126035117 isoform X6 [Accipiter gentilis]XP_04964913